MDLKVTKQTVPIIETVYDGQVQQGIEFDYILPDYYPDIFKILRCAFKTNIISYSLNDDKLLCDGVVILNILYLGEDGKKINCVESRYTFSKTIDLPQSVEHGSVIINPKTDYCTCRAVSDRRLDVRGAISLKIKIIDVKSVEVISDVEGMGIKTLSKPLPYCGNRIIFQKMFSVREEIDAGSITSGEIKNVICNDACVEVNECKVVADKIVIKGEVKVDSAYLCEKDNESNLKSFAADIPISQIIDIDGITEKHLCSCDAVVTSCELMPQKENKEDNVFECELVIQLTVLAQTEELINTVSDLYSIDYDCDYSVNSIKMSSKPNSISQNSILKEKIIIEENVSQLSECRCEIVDVVSNYENMQIVLTGKAVYHIIAISENDMPVYYEQASAFEIVIKTDNDENIYEPTVQVKSCDGNFDKDGNADIRTVLFITGYTYSQKAEKIFYNITVNQDKPKNKNNEYSLKVYYVEKNESIWEIAKKYNTCSEMILEENDIEGNIAENSMLLIPLV